MMASGCSNNRLVICKRIKKKWKDVCRKVGQRLILFAFAFCEKMGSVGQRHQYFFSLFDWLEAFFVMKPVHALTVPPIAVLPSLVGVGRIQVNVNV